MLYIYYSSLRERRQKIYPVGKGIYVYFFCDFRNYSPVYVLWPCGDITHCVSVFILYQKRSYRQIFFQHNMSLLDKIPIYLLQKRYRVFIKYCVFFPRRLESLPPLPRKHSAAIGCTIITSQ